MKDWKSWFGRARQARLTAIYIAPSGGAPMTRVERGEAIAGRGLLGDRYADDRGYYRGPDACPVTMIDARALARAQRRHGVALATGEHRRNLVVQGLDLHNLTRRHVHVGTAVFLCTGPRPPCGYLERLTEKGMVKALLRHPGVCLEVVQDGTFVAGDRVWWS